MTHYELCMLPGRNREAWVSVYAENWGARHCRIGRVCCRQFKGHDMSADIANEAIANGLGAWWLRGGDAGSRG